METTIFAWPLFEAFAREDARAVGEKIRKFTRFED